jgi:hypothetical protein
VKPENGTPPGKSTGVDFTASDIAKFGPADDLCRSRVDALERYAAKNDRDLLDIARKNIGAIRMLERATRTRGLAYAVSEAIRSACGDLLVQHKEFSEMLAREAGDPPVASPH